FHHLVTECLVHAVFTLGNEIERRTESVLDFQVHQLPATIQAFFPFDVVCQNKCELLSSKPTWPVGRRPFTALKNRPAVQDTRKLPSCVNPAHGVSDSSGNPRLQRVVAAV